MAFTQDNKTSSTLTQDDRTAVASITQDSKTVGGALWSASMYPWQMEYPWLWEGNGSQLTSDTRS